MVHLHLCHGSHLGDVKFVFRFRVVRVRYLLYVAHLRHRHRFQLGAHLQRGEVVHPSTSVEEFGTWGSTVATDGMQEERNGSGA